MAGKRKRPDSSPRPRPEAKTGEAGLAAGGLMRAGMAKPPPPALPQTIAQADLGEATARARRRDRVSPQRYKPNASPPKEGARGGTVVPPRLNSEPKRAGRRARP